jgi:RNA polymerase sigma factor (sigma-70 family)
LTRQDRQQVRLVALYVTRAASTGVEDPAARLLLSGVERGLLQSPPGLDGFEGGLREWSFAVAGSVESMTPATALAVCRTQWALMRRAADLMGEFEVTDGVGHERLHAAVEASRLSWEDAYDAWRVMVPRQATVPGDIGRATLAVRLAARKTGDPEKLLGFLGTGFGGNLSAAMAVTPADMRRDSALVSAAVTLEARSDLATTVEPRPALRPEATERPTRRVGPAVVFTADSSRSRLERAAGGSSPDPERPRIEDHAALVELAGLRDAGVIAAAARSGVAEAQVLVAGASPGELDALVERGRLAQAAIVASGVAAARHWSRRIPPALVHAREEYVAEASLRMAEIVDRWDPRRASWGSFAYREAGYEFWDSNRRRAQAREVVSDRIGDFASGLDRTVGPVSVSPEEMVLLGEERELVAQLVDGLPGRLSEVMAGRLGLAGQRKTLAVIGEEAGSSQSTVHRDDREGTRLLQERYLAQQDRQPSPSPSPAAVTLRQLAQVLQPASGEGASAVSVSSRPEHRHQGRGPGGVPGGVEVIQALIMWACQWHSGSVRRGWPLV